LDFSTTRVCLVVPCYNEYTRLDSDTYINFLKANPAFDLCFVNDGSTDLTLDKLQLIKSIITERVDIVNPGYNSGKAEAVRIGINHVFNKKIYQFIGYWDADLSTPLDESIIMLDYAKKSGDYKLIIGSRIKRLGADIRRSPKRFYLSRLFATVASIMLGLPVYDTQCGAKLVHFSIVESVFNQSFQSKWLFDIEIIARLINIFGNASARKLIIEVPLHTWIEMGNSRISTFYLLKAPWEMYMIRRRYKLHRS
jgi:glycosyltransferase involved in cell wall biosynthesis